MMKNYQKFEQTQVWRDARKLSKDLREVVNSNKELKSDPDLNYQMLRSSGSIMDNIAEGYEREGKKELIHFLSIAKGSCAELRSQIFRAYDAHYLSKIQFEEFKSSTETISKQLGGFMSFLRKSNYPGVKFKSD